MKVRVSRFAAALCAALLLASPARADTLGLRYEIYGGGFHLLSFEVSIEQSDDDYRMNSVFKTQGLLDKIVGFLLRAEAVGRIEAGRLKPVEYASSSKMRGKPRTIHVLYAKDGSVVSAETT